MCFQSAQPHRHRINRKLSHGYASVSIVDIGEDLGFDEKHTPFDSERARSLLLYSPYFINTGMNEMGLAFGVMADPEGRSSMDPNKETTFPSEIRRYFLDYATDVGEALAILSKYNIKYDNVASRILLADRSGHSAIVEWVDGSMRVTRNQTPWQVATNVRVYGAQQEIDQYAAEYETSGAISEDVNGRSYWRYITVWEALKQANGVLSMDQSMDLLNTVSLTVTEEVWWPTQYSVIYNLSTGEIQMATDRNYNQIYNFELKVGPESSIRWQSPGVEAPACPGRDGDTPGVVCKWLADPLYLY